MNVARLTVAGLLCVLGLSCHSSSPSAPREASVVSSASDAKGLTLMLKVPPGAGVVSQPGPTTPVVADAQGKVQLFVPADLLPPGKPKVTVQIQPVKGPAFALEYEPQQEVRVVRGGPVPVPEGVDCAALLVLEPGAQVLWQGCPGVKHVINGKPVGQAVEHLTFSEVLGDAPLEQLLPPNGRRDWPTADVQATAESNQKSARAPVPLTGDVRTALGGYFLEHAGKPMAVGGEDLANDHTLALVLAPREGSGPTMLVLGSGPLRELDLVAVYEPRPEKPAPVNCTAVPCAADGGGDLTLMAFGADVTLYDRRTGAVLEKKFFPIGSTTTCPEGALKARLENGSPASIVDVIAWLEPMLTGK